MSHKVYCNLNLKDDTHPWQMVKKTKVYKPTLEEIKALLGDVAVQHYDSSNSKWEDIKINSIEYYTDTVDNTGKVTEDVKYSDDIDDVMVAHYMEDGSFGLMLCADVVDYTVVENSNPEGITASKVEVVTVSQDPMYGQGNKIDIPISFDSANLSVVAGVYVPTYGELKAAVLPSFQRAPRKVLDGAEWKMARIDDMEFYLDADLSTLYSHSDVKYVYQITDGPEDEIGKWCVDVFAKITAYTVIEETKEAPKPVEEPKEEPKTPEANYRVFQETVAKDIDNAIVAATKVAEQNRNSNTAVAAAPIKIDTNNWISFKGNVYQKMEDSGLPVQISFRYKGIRYRVDIPAGADLMSLVDENGYCGFLNLMAHFGGTVIK